MSSKITSLQWLIAPEYFLFSVLPERSGSLFPRDSIHYVYSCFGGKAFTELTALTGIDEDDLIELAGHVSYLCFKHREKRSFVIRYVASSRKWIVRKRSVSGGLV